MWICQSNRFTFFFFLNFKTGISITFWWHCKIIPMPVKDLGAGKNFLPNCIFNIFWLFWTVRSLEFVERNFWEDNKRGSGVCCMKRNIQNATHNLQGEKMLGHKDAECRNNSIVSKKKKKSCADSHKRVVKNEPHGEVVTVWRKTQPIRHEHWHYGVSWNFLKTLEINSDKPSHLAI